MTLIEKKPDEKLQMLQNFFFLLFFWLYNLSLLPPEHRSTKLEKMIEQKGPVSLFED